MPVSCIPQLEHLSTSRESSLPHPQSSPRRCSAEKEEPADIQQEIPSNYLCYPWKVPPEALRPLPDPTPRHPAEAAVDENISIDSISCDGCGEEADLVWRRSGSVTLSQPPPHFEAAKDTVLRDIVGKKLYLFLDYDGTLTPIVRNPWDAKLSSDVRDLLYQLAGVPSHLITVGIVTGRALTSVKEFVQIRATEELNFIYAASHGFHIEAAGKMLHHKVGSRYVPVLKSAAVRVSAALSHIPGLTLEDNEFSFSVHYRNAAVESEVEVERILDKILEDYAVLKKTRGKKVFELRINVVWDKGRAVSWLLKSMRVDPYEPDTRIVYVGDDLTDEDAFRAVRQFDNSLTILVSDDPSSRPTAAAHYVESPGQVADFLRDILQLTNGIL